MVAEKLEQTSFDPRQPFSRAEAREAGIPPDALSSPAYKKICWDVYISGDLKVTPQIRARAILRLVPDTARISHHTAAQIWGGIVPDDRHTHVALPSAKKRVVRRGMRSHYGGTGAATVHRGIPISTPEQTFVELAADGLELVDLVILGDALVKAKRTTPEQLIAASTGYGGRGCRVARRAAALVRAGVDSPMETRLRLLVVLAGLPEPQVNLILRGEDGDWERRFDLAYPALKVIVEYDGRQHAEDIKQWNADIYRREELERQGWRVITVTSEGIYDDPGRTLKRVKDALRLAGCGPLPRTFRPEWRLHFSARA